ncbi:MAG TPA: hypothetical protein VGY54_13595 [Polyangiaceae bacterium]|jgi:hypothetical protein|nr:hypothetical protein [Polyangiaceae bacterium]
MPDVTIDNRTLLRKTLLTVGVMVGACALLVGTLTLLVSAVVGGAVAGPGSDQTAENAPTNTRMAIPTAKTSSPAPPNSPR